MPEFYALGDIFHQQAEIILFGIALQHHWHENVTSVLPWGANMFCRAVKTYKPGNFSDYDILFTPSTSSCFLSAINLMPAWYSVWHQIAFYGNDRTISSIPVKLCGQLD